MAVQKLLIPDATSGLAKAYTPKQTSAGASDAGQIPALDNTGKIPSTMLPASNGMPSDSLTASEAIAAGALVNINSTGQVRNASATDATKPANGFASAAIAQSASGTIYYVGAKNSGATGLTVGAPVFLGTASGAGTSTPPSTAGNLVQYVGTAISATEYVFDPQSRYVL